MACGCRFAFVYEFSILCKHGNEVLEWLHAEMTRAIENEVNMGTFEIDWWKGSFPKRTKDAIKKINSKIDEGTDYALPTPLLAIVFCYLYG